MAVVNGYVTTDELRNWGGSTTTTSTTNLERAINAASRAIDQYRQRTFWLTAAGTSRDFSACNPCRVNLGEFNDHFSATVPPHGVVMVRVTPVTR